MTDSQPIRLNLSVRQLSRLLKRLHVCNGDIVVLRSDDLPKDEPVIRGLSAALNALGVRAVVVMVSDLDDLQVWNETEMNKRGWYRIERVLKITKTPEKDDQHGTKT